MMLKTRRESSLYTMLEAQANVATRAAKAFLIMVDDFGNLKEHAQKIMDLEHEGDDVTHFIEAAAARAELYRIDAPRPEIRKLAEQLVRITELTEEAVGEMQSGFRRNSKLRDVLKEIHTVENESDKQFRTALSNLFH